MLPFVLLLLVALLVLALVIKRNKYFQDNNYPPGPLCIPLIGSMWALGTNNSRTHTSLLAIAKKWGPVCRLHIGSIPFIVVTDPKVIRETFSNVDSSALPRFISITFAKFSKGLSVILPVERTHWVEMRKIHSHFMRNLPGGTPIPKVIATEIQSLFACLDLHISKGAHLNPLFIFFARNVFLQVAFRQSWSYETLKEDEKEYVDALITLIDNASSAVDFFSSLQFLRNKSSECMMQCGQIMNKFVKKMVEVRKREPPRTDENVRDFLDVALIESKRNPKYSEEALHINLRDLILASTYTTADTLDWFVLFLCEYPDIQEKCFKELDEKLQGRIPVMEDQAGLPFLDSVLKESARLRPAVPLGIPHQTDRDCTIGGYKVDKGSVVVKNLYGIGNSEWYFDNPFEFDPDRWIRTPELSHNLLQFGYGPNSCLGINLAKQEVFLAAASLIQRYKFKYDPSSPAPDFIGEFKLAFNPAKWNTIFSHR